MPAIQTTLFRNGKENENTASHSALTSSAATLWSIETEENKQVIWFRDFISFDLINLISCLLFASWNTPRNAADVGRGVGGGGIRIPENTTRWNSMKSDVEDCSVIPDVQRLTIDSCIWIRVIIKIHETSRNEVVQIVFWTFL